MRGIVAALAVGLSAAAPAGAVDLLAARFRTEADHTRIVVDLSGPCAYRHSALDAPPRIVIDVDEARFAFDPDTISVGDGLVKQIRFGPAVQAGGAGRVVVDLEVPARYDVFALDKSDDGPDRLVVDVKRPAGVAPPKPRVERRIGPDSVGDFLIMVDPGHGGDDTGRRNRDGLMEKSLALDYARALKSEIDRRPGFRAALTRDDDVFVPLGKRRQIAEQKRAHLFVSVHFNAAPAPDARGTEIFFVSLKGADDRATRELEDAENSADLVGGLPRTDRDTSQDLTRMIVDLRQSDCVERSQQLAVDVDDAITKLGSMPTRRVKQAGFAVLKQLFIPAMLVEVAFLSNRTDVKWARSRANRDAFVKAMADGIVRYCEEVEVPRLGWRMHVVERGETLAQIAQAYGMDLDSLRAANGLDGDAVRPGQHLRVKRP